MATRRKGHFRVPVRAAAGGKSWARPRGEETGAGEAGQDTVSLLLAGHMADCHLSKVQQSPSVRGHFEKSAFFYVSRKQVSIMKGKALVTRYLRLLSHLGSM